MKIKIWESTAYEWIRRGEPPGDGVGIAKGQLLNRRLLHFDDKDKDFSPRMDERRRDTLPLGTWFLEAKGKMGVATICLHLACMKHCWVEMQR